MHWTRTIARVFAVNLNPRGGRVDPFRAEYREGTARRLAIRVGLLLADGHKLANAYDYVSNEEGLKRRTIQRAWNRTQHLVANINLQQRDREALNLYTKPKTPRTMPEPATIPKARSAGAPQGTAETSIVDGPVVPQRS